MSEVVFVKPRHIYHSYQDYWRLVELNNYAWCYEDEMNAQDESKVYILTWFGAQGDGWQGAKAHIIVWNLEWHQPDHDLPGVKEWWSPDAAFARQNNWRYVPCGSDTRLNPHPNVRRPRGYDVALMMYRDPHRRAHLIWQMQQRGLKIAPDGWDINRHRSLQTSRVQVHIHQHEQIRAVSPLRFAVAAAYQLPIITETLEDSGILSECLLQADYAHLPNAVVDHLGRNRVSMLHACATLLHVQLCHHHTFTKCIQAAL